MENLKLTKEEQERFVEALLKPPPLTPAMERAIELHKQIESDMDEHPWIMPCS